MEVGGQMHGHTRACCYDFHAIEKNISWRTTRSCAQLIDTATRYPPHAIGNSNLGLKLKFLVNDLKKGILPPVTKSKKQSYTPKL